MGLFSRIKTEKSVPLNSDLVTTLENYLKSYQLNFDVQFNEIEKLLTTLKYYETFASKVLKPAQEIQILNTEEVAISFLMKYLTCTIFEKKFSAINALTKKIELYKKSADKDQYRNSLLKNGILSTLYIDGYHPEIAKKSDEALAFLAPILKIDKIKELMVNAFKQSSEKGGVFCLCVKKALQGLEIEVLVQLPSSSETS
jgi:hypothetical protein